MVDGRIRRHGRSHFKDLVNHVLAKKRSMASVNRKRSLQKQSTP